MHALTPMFFVPEAAGGRCGGEGRGAHPDKARVSAGDPDSVVRKMFCGVAGCSSVCSQVATKKTLVDEIGNRCKTGETVSERHRAANW